MKLILGSQSPRRRELLGRMGLEFTVLTAEIDETKYETEDPEASVRRICAAKAAAVALEMQNVSAFSAESPVGSRGMSRTAVPGATSHAFWRLSAKCKIISGHALR